MRKLGSIPTVIILSQVFLSLDKTLTVSDNCSKIIQDSFYKHHNEEELALAHANMLDFDHPDAIDMKLFASVRSSLKSFRLYYTFSISSTESFIIHTKSV